MRKLFILLVCFTLPAFAATTYKWVDEDGKVHYSDTPVEGAEEVRLPDVTTFDAPDLPAGSPAPSNSQPPAPKPQYSKFALTSPAVDEVIWTNEGIVTVQFEVDPPLQKGHYVAFYLDGERLEKADVEGTTATLQRVFRGTHTLYAVVFGPTGQQKIKSKPITFHVQRHVRRGGG
ncbi:MAG: DUF4124 domain-containing protein [Gammaproteobacteria bacterium]|nr:DUF4124 domain-containing protein [Gammaproteobacteria bacterium]